MDVTNFNDAYKMIKWYAMRWNIETYFKILKSGCGTERSKLRCEDGLTKFISICAVIAWKVFWLNMINRTNPGGNAKQVFNKEEYQALEAYKKQKNPHWKGKTISEFILVIAELGGYMGRTKDYPPGNIIIWRGISRLYDIMIGFNLRGLEDVGN